MDYKTGDRLKIIIPPCGHLTCYGHEKCLSPVRLSPGSIVMVRVVNETGQRHIDWKIASVTVGNGSVIYAPDLDEIEEALQQGKRSLADWGIWRCEKCGKPGAGGLVCPSCGADPPL